MPELQKSDIDMMFIVFEENSALFHKLGNEI